MDHEESPTPPVRPSRATMLAVVVKSTLAFIVLPSIVMLAAQWLLDRW